MTRASTICMLRSSLRGQTRQHGTLNKGWVGGSRRSVTMHPKPWYPLPLPPSACPPCRAPPDGWSRAPPTCPTPDGHAQQRHVLGFGWHVVGRQYPAPHPAEGAAAAVAAAAPGGLLSAGAAASSRADSTPQPNRRWPEDGVHGRRKQEPLLHHRLLGG